VQKTDSIIQRQRIVFVDIKIFLLKIFKRNTSFIFSTKGNYMFNRREFLMNSALLGSAAMFLPACVSTPKMRKFGPNDKVNVAIVGIGGRGAATVKAIDECHRANIVAFCDVDEQRVAKAKSVKVATAKKKIPLFHDYRVMLDKMDKDIDAVAVCTPDHMHYPICAWAIAKGKHVFCEKPLTRTIWEARELKRLANEAGVKSQMGNQGHTYHGWKELREWVEAGLLGEIEEIYMWTNRPLWPQGASLSMPKAQPIPTTLDYKLWLGVAPFQPYNQVILPFNWRGIRNYGTGAAGDMACHFFDTPYSGLNLGYPTNINVKSAPFNDYSFPAYTEMVMDFDNKFGKGGKIRLNWSDGKIRPKAVKRIDDAFMKDPRNANCLFVVGSKATFGGTHYGTQSMIYPRDMMREYKKNGMIPAPKYKRSKTPGNPQADWVYAIANDTTPESNFDYACPFTEMVLLSMVGALVPNRDLKYNPEKMKFDNCPEADRLVSSLYDYNTEFLP